MSSLNVSFDPMPELANFRRRTRIVMFSHAEAESDGIDVSLPVNNERHGEHAEQR
jgi:hypothetical protein